jgi:hypothetical protein
MFEYLDHYFLEFNVNIASYLSLNKSDYVWELGIRNVYGVVSVVLQSLYGEFQPPNW